MSNTAYFLKKLDNFETVFCEILLASFVLLLFGQIMLRILLGYSIAWSEELSTYMFVWFAYMGSVVAAKMAAHNRVTFQFNYMPAAAKKYLLALADLTWIAFNLYFAYLSYIFTFHLSNPFWKSQTLGIPMKFMYMVLPFAFILLSIRILLNLYVSFFKGIELVDPETAEIEKMKQQAQNTSTL